MDLTAQERNACAEVAKRFGQISVFRKPQLPDMARFFFFPTVTDTLKIQTELQEYIKATRVLLKAKFEELKITDQAKQQLMEQLVVALIRFQGTGIQINKALAKLQPLLSEIEPLMLLKNTTDFMVNQLQQ